MKFRSCFSRNTKFRGTALIFLMLTVASLFSFSSISLSAKGLSSTSLPSGTILFGTVRDSSTNDPIPNAIVFFKDHYEDYYAITDSNGMYFLTHKPTGMGSTVLTVTYKVLASAKGHRSESEDVQVIVSDNFESLQPIRRDFSLQPVSVSHVDISYPETPIEDIVEYYSPVFYQETEIQGEHSLGGRADYITKFNFDGNWVGKTKWVMAEHKPLNAYIYYDIRQTKYYWFIYYAIYHPRDWNTAGKGDLPIWVDLGEHEHDMEAVLLAVLKDGSPYGRLIIIESMAHNVWFNYPVDPLAFPMKEDFDADQARCGPQVCRGVDSEEFSGGKHPIAYMQAEGHSIFFDQTRHTLATSGRPYAYLTDWDKTDFHGGTGVVYRYGGKAEEPESPNDRNVSYELLKIGELWEKRNNKSTFSPTYEEDIKKNGKVDKQAFNSNYQKEAHPPWTTPNKDSAYEPSSYPIGQEFSDPASALASRYAGFVPRPYLNPIITSPLKITPSPPYHRGDTINAEFTISNKGTAPITFSILTVGGCDPDDRVADFTFMRDITLNPNKSYNYKGSLALAKAGNYHFFCAYQTIDGHWNPSVDLALGLTDEDRTEDITVKARLEEPPKKPIIKVSKGSKSYYPLDEGKTWEYQALLKKVDRLGESRTLEKVVITNFPQREFKGEKVTPRRTEVKVETSSYTSFLFYAEDANGIRTVAFQNPGQVEPEMLSSRDYFIKDPIEVGATWSSIGTFFMEPEIPTSVKATIESVDEVVTVSAGTFKECLKFHIIAFAEKKDLDDNSTFRIDAQAYFWLAPGVGLIKMIYKDKITSRDRAVRLSEFLTCKSMEMTMQLEKFK